MEKNTQIHNIILALVLVAIVAFLFVFFSGNSENQTETVLEDMTKVETIGPEPEPLNEEEQDSKDKAWEVFSEYLMALKEHNKEKVRELSYQQSETCRNPETKSDCFALMDDVYEIASGFKKELFVNLSEDSRQLILFTNPTKDPVSKVTAGLVRGYIFFTKTTSGEYKMLSLSPGKGKYVAKEAGIDEETYQELLPAVLDSDQDGAYDVEELCADNYAEASCVKTDPQKKDSDGDGWWDGIEILFY